MCVELRVGKQQMIADTDVTNATLKRILETGVTVDLSGRHHRVEGGVNKEEAGILTALVKQLNPRTTLETGTAFGVSALAICGALSSLPAVTPIRHHYGVDPYQLRDYKGAALAGLQKAGLAGYFTLLEGPAHLKLPDLLAQGTELDFAFIDGWHTFDYKLLDFFYIDKMLRPGGVVAFHDYQWSSTSHVVRFALTHRRYHFQHQHRSLFHPVSLPVRLARFAKVTAMRSGRKTISRHWRILLWNTPSIAILTKMESFEPNYDFFARL